MFKLSYMYQLPLFVFGLMFATGSMAGLVPPEGIYQPPDLQSPGCEVTGRVMPGFKDYIKPGWQEAPQMQQKLLITSDPQPFRHKLGMNRKIKEPWTRITNRMADILRSEREGGRYVPLIINGDITEYGHGDERAAFRSFIQKTMSKSGGGPLFLPGLGNHDYANNVGKCANNGCARDAVCDHIGWARTLRENAQNFSFDHAFRDGTHTGSLAYSFDIGRLHIVQLNNEPGYTQSFETGGVAKGFKRRFNITSSMSWLERDLQEAKRRGKVTIINMHKPNDWQDGSIRAKFKQLIEENHVVALFAGHHHGDLGKMNYSMYGKVPLYSSGAIMFGTYLRVTFDWSTSRMRVEWFDEGTLKGQDTQPFTVPATDIPPVTTKPITIPVGK
ncbi:metallophosphoesterase family protein [Enterobacterales bacterium BD_CKDN230030183-1A_HGKHYDSX7]